MREKFTIAAEAVGAVIKQFSTIEETTLYLQQIATGGSICASILPEELQAQLAGLVLSELSMAADATLCISFAEAGIAATGSILVQMTDPAERAATALATKHAVFLRSASIVPTLRDLSASLKAQLFGAGPTYFSITTGPSRTADIERVLTIGVHGPKELHILLLEGE
ncbi:MAG: LUD domain-containing protein [Desulfuromonadales bacterium]|nr:LUD domain-containing protein [Desulfuromonadales bacterium]